MLGAAVWLLAAGIVYGPVLPSLRITGARTQRIHMGSCTRARVVSRLAAKGAVDANPASPSAAGLLILASSLGLFVAGSVGAELFVTRVSLIGVLAGTVVYAFGWRHLRLVAFPLAFLLFMIPLPSIVFGHAAVSLQLMASQLGERLIRAADVPVLRDGNLLTLANVTLEVNEACSGIRSLGGAADDDDAGRIPLPARRMGASGARGGVHSARDWTEWPANRRHWPCGVAVRSRCHQ